MTVLRRHPDSYAHLPRAFITPWIGAATCAFLAGPWARSAAQMNQYCIAGWLLAIGLVLWAATWLWNRVLRRKPHPGSMGDVEKMRAHHGDAPRNGAQTVERYPDASTLIIDGRSVPVPSCQSPIHSPAEGSPRC